MMIRAPQLSWVLRTALAKARGDIKRSTFVVANQAPSLLGCLRACIGATHTESQARPTRRAASVACAAHVTNLADYALQGGGYHLKFLTYT